jgi:hypothetical protein
MSTVTKAANAHTVVATGWTNPENCYSTSNDSTYATRATAKNTTYSGDFGFPAFTTAEIPDHSTISSVVFYTTYGLTATATGALVGEQARRNSTGTTLGSEITRSAASMADANGTATGCTLTDLRTANELRVRARATKGNSSTASTAQIDRLYVTVTFTEDVTAAAGAIALSASMTAAGTKSISKAIGALANTASFAEAGQKATSGAAGAIALSISAMPAVGAKGISAAAGSIALTATLEATGTSVDARSGSGTMTLTATLSGAGSKGHSVALGTITYTVTPSAAGAKAHSVAVGAIALSATPSAAGAKGISATVSLPLTLTWAEVGKKGISGTGTLTIVPQWAEVGAKGSSGVASLTIVPVLAATGTSGQAIVAPAGTIALSATLTATGVATITEVALRPPGGMQMARAMKRAGVRELRQLGSGGGTIELFPLMYATGYRNDDEELWLFGLEAFPVSGVIA